MSSYEKVKYSFKQLKKENEVDYLQHVLDTFCQSFSQQEFYHLTQHSWLQSSEKIKQYHKILNQHVTEFLPI